MKDSSSPRPLLEIAGLRFGHPGTPLFDGFSADFPVGVTLVYGGDGRGKTSLLRLLAGELRPQAGTIRLGGVDPAADDAGWRQRVLLAGAGAQAFEQSTPIECFAALRERWPGFDDARLVDLVEALALGSHLEKRLFMLSTGSKRKVWLAGAFAACAPVTLIDDPFGALDRQSVGIVERVLGEAAARADRIWVVGHHAPLSAVRVTTTVDLGD